MVEAETVNSRDKDIINSKLNFLILIPMPGSSKTFSADFRGILLYERNQIVCYVAFIF